MCCYRITVLLLSLLLLVLLLRATVLLPTPTPLPPPLPLFVQILNDGVWGYMGKLGLPRWPPQTTPWGVLIYFILSWG